MATLFIKSRAKINFSLNVLGINNNNYHDLDMIICPVSMYDDIILTPKNDGINFVCTNINISNENNLAYKAAKAILEYSTCDKGIDIYLDKKIWMEAGLGGGSSNAAAVLMGINTLYQLNLKKSELAQIAIKLGADVPLFLNDGLTRVQGIGDQIECYPFDNKYYLLIVQGKKGLSTKKVFTIYDNNPCRGKVDNTKLIKAMQEKDIEEIKNNMHNCLQNTAKILNNEVGQILDMLKTHGAIKAMLTGSGSAVYGIFKDRKSADTAREKLKNEYKNTKVVCTKSKYIVQKTI